MSRSAAARKTAARKTSSKPAAPKIEAKTLERVRRGERVVIRRGKKSLAAVVSLADLKALEEMEDRRDIEAADRAHEAALTKGTISLEEFRKELNF